FVTNASKIFQDDVYCEVIKIGGVVRNKDRFVRRRQRLIGPNESTLKAMEVLTRCHIVVAGQTVACLGDWKGIKRVRKIVLDCMNNIHPIYSLKTLMIERELARNEQMKNKDWQPYIPHFKKIRSQTDDVKVKKKKSFDHANGLKGAAKRLSKKLKD
ncbi:KRR1 small subunit processome component, partial [Gregarina niphandrodes]